MGELILVFAIVVIFFGASRLPALGEGLGKALRNLKSAAQTAVKDDAPERQERAAGERGGEGGGAKGA